jgi:hypothetical protein
MILDGRNRYAACMIARVEPVFVEFTEDDALGFVISKNIHRRHLNESQRAVVAAKIANMKQGERTDIEPSANLPKVRNEVSQDQAAEMLSISPRMVRTIKSIERDAPDLIERIVSGDLTAHAATKEIETRLGDRAHVSNNSGEQEWYTPVEYVEAARRAMGSIDLDPASCESANATVMADYFFTKEDDGLTQEWYGRVWLNPPYSQPDIAQFSDKLIGSLPDIEQACVLVNNATETDWFQAMLKSADAVCFPNKRIKFIDKNGTPRGAPLQGQAVLYFGDKRAAFDQWFSQFGLVLYGRH